MNTGAVRVRPGMFPDTMTTAPNSPMLRAKASSVPAAMAGLSAGSMTLRNVVHRRAPSTRAASSSAGSSSSSTGCTLRTTNGSVTNSSARRMPSWAKTMWIPWRSKNPPSGEFGPYSATSITPATRVGTAKGRSTTVARSSRPGNLIRTRTYASSVPSTALITAVTAATIRVSRMASHAPNVESASLRSVSPWANPEWMTAETGRTITKPRYSRATPRRARRPAAAPGWCRVRPRDRSAVA